MSLIVMPFLIAWIGGLVLVPRIRQIALRLGLVDQPNRRKIHTEPTPRVGGIAIYLGTFIGALPFLSEASKIQGVLLAGTFIFIIGLLDDILDLAPKVKLAGMILAVFILFLYRVRIEFVTDFFAGQGLVALGLLTYPLTLLWVVGLTNTVNLIDGVDGLAGGVAFIALATLLAVRLIAPHSQDATIINNVLVVTAALMGSLLAFLKYNVAPASIFMGDAGAYFLGFNIASLSMLGAAKGSILLPLVVPVVALGLPVLDVGMAIVRRARRRVPIFQADKEHVHHRLLDVGFTPAETARFLWLVSTCFGLLAILTSGSTHRGLTTLITILLVIMVGVTVAYFSSRYHGRTPS